MARGLLLALAATAAAIPTPEESFTRIPLNERRSLSNHDGTVNFDAVVAEFNHALAKYKSPNRVSLSHFNIGTSLFGRAVSSESLTDQVEQGEDELYYGNANVNTQTFTIDFDTGSADFFVPGPSCGTAQGCVGTTKYNQKGQAEGNTTSVTYGSGSVSGNNYFDTVSVAGLSAKKTNVVSLTQAQGFSTSQSEGLMGMAFSSIANSKQPTFFENLMSQKVVSAPQFAFYLGRSASGTQSKSELTLGGTDRSKYTGSLTAVPVSSKTYWQVALDSVKVAGKSAGLVTRGQAAIDTGTTVIIAPTLAAYAIFNQIPGSQVIQSGLTGGGETIFAYPCNSNPKVSITFGGKDYIINPLDFNLGQVSTSDAQGLFSGLFNQAASGPMCAAAIFGADLQPGQNFYVVGDSFLKNWYSVYSYSPATVSFAPAAGNQ